MHIGIVAPEAPSHIANATTIGVALQSQGHRVTYFGLADARSRVEQAGLTFIPIAPKRFPEGTVARRLDQLTGAKGLRAGVRTTLLYKDLADARLSELPGLARRVQIEGFVADQMSPGLSSVCEWIGIPFVNICSALPLNRDPWVPPFFTSWLPDRSRLSAGRYRAAWAIMDAALLPTRRRIAAFRREHGLPELGAPGSGLSSRLQLSAWPEGLDFPYRHPPSALRYVGPFTNHAAESPWTHPARDGRPLVYASLGTIHSHAHALTQQILNAFTDSPYQLVLSRGGGLRELALSVPRGVIVEGWLPQTAVLREASAFITHAGQNSAIESLCAGVPMLTIPLANDQPGVAARLLSRGLSRRLMPNAATPTRIRDEVHRLCADPSYREATAAVQQSLTSRGGADHAARLLASALGR